MKPANLNIAAVLALGLPLTAAQKPKLLIIYVADLGYGDVSYTYNHASLAGKPRPAASS